MGVEQPVYKLSMISMTEKPQATSEDSNVVELLSEQFRPFAFYCYHAVHSDGIKLVSILLVENYFYFNVFYRKMVCYTKM